MKTRITQISILVFVMAMTIVGCRKYDPSKLTSTAWNPNLAVPLAHGHFTVYDVLARTDSNDIVIIDPNTGAIALVYRGELDSYTADDLVQMGDYSQSVSFNDANYGVGVSGGYSGTANSSQGIVVNPNVNSGVELYTATLNSGNLTISMTTTLMHDLDVVITIPDLLESGGTPFTRTVSLNYAGSVPQTTSSVIDLSGATFDFTNGGGSFNEFDIQSSLTISGTGQPVTGAESVDLQFDFTTLDFHKCTGYFGQQTITVDNDSIQLKIFNEDPDGFFQLLDPKIHFIVTNEFGFPSQINLSNLETIDANSGSSYTLSGYPSQINVAAPSTMGDFTTTSLELNTSNTTNIANIITPSPKWFYFEGAATSNPGGNLGPNFLIDTSRLVIDAEVEMPLEGYAYGFSVTDTIEFSFSENVNNIESLMFRVNVVNGFPAQLEAQVEVLDTNKNVLFTLFQTAENVLEPAPVNSSGRVIEPIQKITDIFLNENQISLLKDAGFIVVSGVAESWNGTTGQVVKIFEDYVIDLKLGMQVQGKFNF